jgi:hypothetical protein
VSAVGERRVPQNPRDSRAAEHTFLLSLDDEGGHGSIEPRFPEARRRGGLLHERLHATGLHESRLRKSCYRT